MSGTIPPIPPPFGASSGNPGIPNVNRVDMMSTTTDPINTMTTRNVSQSVVDENLPQLLDSRGGSHVINVLAFDKEDFTICPLLKMLCLNVKINGQMLCKTAKEMQNDLILAHEGPSDTRDTKIAALRLKFNAFKSLKGEKVNGTFTRLKFLLNDLENNGVTIPQAEVNATDSDVEEDQRTSNEFMADLNVEYHERALLENQKRFYKRSGRDDESVSSDDEGSTKIRAFMTIAEDEPSIGKADVRSGQWVDIIMKKSECDSHEPLLPLPKLIGAAPFSTLESLISLSDLTLNMADLTLDTPDPKKTRPSIKVSHAYVIKNKTEKSLVSPKPCFDKKADSSTEQLLLTLMKEVKVLKRQIEIPLGTPPSNSQPSSSKVSKQKTWFGPCKHCGFRNHLFDDCNSKPKCSTCGSTNHLTKEHLEHVVVKKTLSKLKAQSPLKPSPKKAPMIPKPFIECKYSGFNDHHSDQCDFYLGCEVYGSIEHEVSDCPKKHPNSRRPRIANKQSELTEKWVHKKN
ncbi:hypothetical protein Tco_1458670 [Tanacetum coccineum]